MKCKFIKENGQCRANALRDKDFCFFHDDSPESIKKRRDTALKAGNANKLILSEPNYPISKKISLVDKPLNITNRRNISRAIAWTAYEIRSGKISVKVGNAVINALKVLVYSISTLEDGGLEKVMKALDKAGIEILDDE